MSHHGKIKPLAPNQIFSAKQYTYFDHQGNPVSDWSSQCLLALLLVWSSLREYVKFSFPFLTSCFVNDHNIFLLLAISCPFPIISLSFIPQLLFLLFQRGESAPRLWLMKKGKLLSLIGKLPCKAALFHYKLSQQAVRQISCIREPTEQQGQARSRACGDVACKSTDPNVDIKRFSPRSSGTAVLQYEVMDESYSTDPKVCDRVFSDGKIRK